MFITDSEKSAPHPADTAPERGGGQAHPGSELPAHRIRRSKRARRINLRVLPGTGLEVVLPVGVDPALVPEVLQRNRDWIEKALGRMGMEAPAGAGRLPDLLHLKGGKEDVEIRLHGQCPRKAILPPPGQPCGPHMRENAHGIAPAEPVRRILQLPKETPEASLRRLRAWLREEARPYLSHILDDIARRHGFRYVSLGIRFQKSRWGSCSAKGAISLNAALIFLPETLVQYIALHELCHTRQMNHSDGFWKLLFSVDPDALAKDKAMRKAWRYVPGWVFGA